MTKRKRNIIIALIILAIAALTGWHVYGKMKAGAGGGFPPSAVNVAAAKMQPWQTQIQATGTLNAVNGVMLKSEVAGRITKIYADSGQEVAAGAPLLDVDPGILQAQLAAAQAQADLNTGDYQRALELYKRGALSKQDLDTALANKNSAVAQANAVQAQLTQNCIRAPFAGRIGIRLFNLGDYITAGQALENLQSLDPLRVDFSIPENNLGNVQMGDTISLRSDVYPNLTFNGKLAAIDSAIDTDSRTVALRAEVPNPQKKLLPGSFVQVTLFAGAPKPMLTLPLSAVVFDPEGDYVYAVVKGVAVKTPITIIEQSSSQVAVQSTLKAGDMVVVAGQLKIGDGMPVMVMPAT